LGFNAVRLRRVSDWVPRHWGWEGGSLTLVHPLRWRLTNAGVERGAGGFRSEYVGRVGNFKRSGLAKVFPIEVSFR
jgi:hypothetical protein